MNHILRTVAALLFLLPMACTPAAPQHAPLEGASIGGPFTLTDQNGQSISDAAFKGRYRIMYFGYTFCPDVCPIDVQKIGAGLRALEKSDPALGAKVVPIFVTVDPERDTPAVLKQFVGAFHPRMIGLTGSPAAIASTAKEFAIYYKKGETQPGGGYLMDHQRVAYLMDPAGKPLALLPIEEGVTPDQIAAEIKRWAR